MSFEFTKDDSYPLEFWYLDLPEFMELGTETGTLDK